MKLSPVAAFAELTRARERRLDSARRAASRARVALADAEQALSRARRVAERAALAAKRDVDAMFADLCSRLVKAREVEDVRARQASMVAKVAGLRADATTRAREAQDRAREVEAARLVAQTAAQASEKIALGARRAKAAAKRTQEQAADNELDEFTTARYEAKPRRRRGVAALLLVGLAIGFATSARAQSSDDAVSPPPRLSWSAEDAPLALALGDLAATAGYAARFDGLAEAVVARGVWRGLGAADLLDVVAEAHEVDWWLDGMEARFSPRGLRREQALELPTRAALVQLRARVEEVAPGAFVRFPLRVRPLPGPGVEVRMRGPESFLALVEAFHEDAGAMVASGGRDGGDGRGAMVFRLRHAWAEDREFQLGERVQVVPGVATLLRALAGQGGTALAAQAQPVAAAFAPLAPLTPVTRAGVNHLDAGQAGGDPGFAPWEPLAEEGDAPALDVGAPVIIADARLNAVLVHDDLARETYYRRLVQDLDKPTRLVEVEATIVDISRNAIADLGVDWRVNGGNSGFGFGDPSREDSASSSASVALSLGVGRLTGAVSSGAAGLLARIRALESKGETRIVSQPTVVTLDNLEAVIDARERRFIRVEGFQDTSLYPIAAGVTLRVTPHVIDSKDGEGEVRVRLFVVIEDGDIVEHEFSLPPSVVQNTVSTHAVVGQDGGLLIGGHNHSVNSVNKVKVPFFGDIPLIGLAFRRRQTVAREFVRMFLIRPKVHPLGEGL